MVILDKDQPLSREVISAIALDLYGPGIRWYALMARDLAEINNTPRSISPAIVQQWMSAENRKPPWWLTELIYKLIAKKHGELIIRTESLESWKKNIAKSCLRKSPDINFLTKDNT